MRTGTPPTAASSTEQGPAAGTWASLRPLVLRLHFFAGVLVAPFVVVAALSGGLYALATPLERVLYAEQLLVEPAEEALPLAEQVRIAQGASSVQGLVGLRPPPAEDASTRVLFDDGTLGASTLHAVFVDPGTGAVLGQERVYGTSGSLPVRTWISDLHRSLHLGAAGRHYSELAASWLWVVALGGLALRLGRVRHSRHRRPSVRQRTRSRHGALGVWLVVGLLMLSATGLTWSRWAGAHLTGARAALGWDAPAVSTALQPSAADGGAGGEHAHHGASAAAGAAPAADPADVDEVLAAVRGSGLTSSEIEVRLPSTSDQAWTVTEVHRSFPTQVDAAAVHPETLQVLDVVRFADYPLMAKLARWGVDLHMGTMFGLPNQLALAALAVAVVVLVLLGYRMWWQRRPRAATGLRPGAPYPRGAWRTAPRWALALLVVAVLAVGWSLPVLGVSLLGFLLLDAVLGWWSRRRGGAAGAAGPDGDGHAGDGSGGLPRQRRSATTAGAGLVVGAVLVAVPLGLRSDGERVPGVDSVEVAFARDMQAHHDGGLPTAERVVAERDLAPVVELARTVVADQTAELQLLDAIALHASGGTQRASGGGAAGDGAAGDGHDHAHPPGDRSGQG